MLRRSMTLHAILQLPSGIGQILDIGFIEKRYVVASAKGVTPRATFGYTYSVCTAARRFK